MKVCTKCHIEKEETNFWKDRGRKDGLCPYCKNCAVEMSIAFRRKNGIPEKRPRTEDELPLFKTCTRCKVEKGKDGFRIKKSDGKYVSLNSTCKNCDTEMARIYYNKHRDLPEFKEKNKTRQKEYMNKSPEKTRKIRTETQLKIHADRENKRYHSNKERVSQRMKAKRQTPEYKKMMRDYRRKNKEKIYQQELITKHRYHEKNKTKITDKYVSFRLKAEGIEITPGNIEIKRTQILLHRIKKAMKRKRTGILKVCTRCNVAKDRSDFYPIGKTKKIMPACKVCCSKISKKYREAKRSI